MNRLLEKVNLNPLWIFLIGLSSVWQIVSPLITNIKSTEEMVTPLAEYYKHYDWVGFVLQWVTLIALYILWRNNYKMKRDFADRMNSFNDRMNVFGVISHARNKMLFLKHHENVQHFWVEGESYEDYLQRLPENQPFNEHLHDEYVFVRAVITKKMKHKTTAEIDQLLKQFYPSEFINS